MTWDELCTQKLGMARRTVEGTIKRLEEFGDRYFGLRTVIKISPDTYRQIEGSINERGELEYDDEKIPLTKANASRVREAIGQIQDAVRREKRRAADAERATEKAREQRDTARDEAKKLKQAEKDRRDQEEKLFAGADPDHRLMLEIQSRWDFCLSRMETLFSAKLSSENEGRLIGLVEYLFRTLAQETSTVRHSFGLGLNAPDPSVELGLLDGEDRSRNLVHEFAEAGREKQ